MENINLKKIKSFEVDHRKIKQGMYISRIDGDITTYDIRMVIPNSGDYLENDGLHTFEHLFATFMRSSNYSGNVVYVGPMGCRTGFYLLMRDISDEITIDLVKKAMDFISEYDGDIPGATEKECGNYKEHNLEKAQNYAKVMQSILKNYSLKMLKY
ncbi:MAG: S-ribosylhomocysteine lyase [Clostridia bacterium]|nr:S-ribosylhomocysteine lyase [Clostridia bacterium]